VSEYPQIKPGNYSEAVRDVLCLLTAADRQTGRKTVVSLEMQAKALRMPKRRPRAIFERDRTPLVGILEYLRVLLLGAAYLKRRAHELRMQADRWEAEAEELQRKHQKLVGETGIEWTSHGGSGPRKLAA